MLRRIAELGVSVNGKEVAHAIATLSDDPVPEDIVHMLCLVALEDPIRRRTPGKETTTKPLQ